MQVTDKGGAVEDGVVPITNSKISICVPAARNVCVNVCSFTRPCGLENALLVSSVLSGTSDTLVERTSHLHRQALLKSNNSNPTLTSRESEILRWIAKGKRDREIGTILNCSSRTVQKHVQNILEKLQVETRGAAAAWWYDHRSRN
jgi:DNA-binding CsgD family transcriptional regulator